MACMQMATQKNKNIVVGAGRPPRQLQADGTAALILLRADRRINSSSLLWPDLILAGLPCRGHEGHLHRASLVTSGGERRSRSEQVESEPGPGGFRFEASTSGPASGPGAAAGASSELEPSSAVAGVVAGLSSPSVGVVLQGNSTTLTSGGLLRGGWSAS